MVLLFLVLEGVFQIVVAIRKPQSGLRGVKSVAGWIFLILAHPYGEETRAEATASRTTHQGCDVGLGFGVADFVEIVRDRRDIPLLDPSLIHERVVERADLALVGGR